MGEKIRRGKATDAVFKKAVVVEHYYKFVGPSYSKDIHMGPLVYIKRLPVYDVKNVFLADKRLRMEKSVKGYVIVVPNPYAYETYRIYTEEDYRGDKNPLDKYPGF